MESLNKDSHHFIKVPTLSSWAVMKAREHDKSTKLPLIKKIRILEQMCEIKFKELK